MRKTFLGRVFLIFSSKFYQNKKKISVKKFFGQIRDYALEALFHRKMNFDEKLENFDEKQKILTKK